MPSSLPTVPFALISYRHESPEHIAQVHHLVAALRARGLALAFDHDHVDPHDGPEEGWTIWMQLAVERAAALVVVWSPGYRQSWDQLNPIDAGNGVKWESQHLRARFYGPEDKRRIISVILQPKHRQSVPALLRSDYSVYPYPDKLDRIGSRIGAWLNTTPTPPSEPDPPLSVPDTSSTPPPVSPATRKALVELLLALFLPAELRIEARYEFGDSVYHQLPPNSSPWDLSVKLVDVLAGSGDIGPAFFAWLRRLRPRQEARIAAAEAVTLR